MAEYLRNAWYMAAGSDELQAGQTLPRTIAERPLLLLRTEVGEAGCLLDRCPHRFAPLSLGRVEGSSIRCGYHGIRFALSGACVENPHGPVMPALSVKAFPVTEKYGLLWVWLGPADAADPTLIPDLSFIEATPPTAFNRQYLPIRAHHLLVVDNIMDLTHTDYLHPTSFGGGSNTRAHPKIELRAAGCVFVQWLANNEPPSPIVRSGFPNPETRVDMWTEELWHPCGVVLVTYGATLTGRPRQEGIQTINAHFVTPESSSSTHYFYCSTRNFQADSAAANLVVTARLRRVIETEDKPMIEAQQRRIGDVDPLALGPVLQQSDAASVLVRRTIARMIANERPRAGKLSLGEDLARQDVLGMHDHIGE